jgi:hypothetical protein
MHDSLLDFDTTARFDVQYRSNGERQRDVCVKGIEGSRCEVEDYEVMP